MSCAIPGAIPSVGTRRAGSFVCSLLEVREQMLERVLRCSVPSILYEIYSRFAFLGNGLPHPA